MAAIVEGNGLTKRFGTGDAMVVAIDSVDITIEESELVMIMGDSGCGKTTLISLLGCILTPDAGQIRIDGEPVNPENQDMSVIRREKIGFVFQLFHLLPYLTALEKRHRGDGPRSDKDRCSRKPGNRTPHTGRLK